METCARREFLEETSYRVSDLTLLTEFIDSHAEGFPPLRLAVFWCRYDGVQPLTCHEGQALEFIPRALAAKYPIPRYLVDLWDRALEAARLVVVES
jgi:8-oxo-dGTP pyrophosphatase MutT (NUDIX family)